MIAAVVAAAARGAAEGGSGRHGVAAAVAAAVRSWPSAGQGAQVGSLAAQLAEVLGSAAAVLGCSALSVGELQRRLKGESAAGLRRRLSALNKARNVEAHPDTRLGLEIHDLLRSRVEAGGRAGMEEVSVEENVLEEREQECIDDNLVCGLAVDNVTDELLFKPGGGGDMHGEQLLCKPDHARGTMGDEVDMEEEGVSDEREQECINGNLAGGAVVGRLIGELPRKPGYDGDKHGEQSHSMDEGGGVADMMGEELLCKPDHVQGAPGDKVEKMSGKGKKIGSAGVFKSVANGGKQGDKGHIMDNGLGTVCRGVVDMMGKERCKPDGFDYEREDGFKNEQKVRKRSRGDFVKANGVNHEREDGFMNEREVRKRPGDFVRYAKLVRSSFKWYARACKVRDDAVVAMELKDYVRSWRVMRGGDPRTEAEVSAAW